MVRTVIALVNFNGYRTTTEAIDSLLPSLDSADTVLVVDNGSSDGSAERLARSHPSVQVLVLSQNRGYAGGCNAAIEFALREGAEYVLLANNDITFAPDAVERLIQTARSDTRIAIVVPRIYYSAHPDRVWAAGSTISRTTGLTRQRGMGFDESAFPPEPAPLDLDMCTGCAMLVRTSAVPVAGRMRDEFFLYYDETDWCWRIREAGFRIVLDDRAHIWHKVSESVGVLSPTFWYYLTRNHILFVHLDFPASRRFAALVYIVAVMVPHRWLLVLARGEGAQASAMIRGSLDGFKAALQPHAS